MWDELLSAFALVLILEGILPFVSPAFWRDMMHQAGQLNDKQLRSVGAVCMLIGLVALYLIR